MNDRKPRVSPRVLARIGGALYVVIIETGRVG